MEKKYYITIGGRLAGPFTPEELLHQGLTSESRIFAIEWNEMRSASDVPELVETLKKARKNSGFDLKNGGKEKNNATGGNQFNGVKPPKAPRGAKKGRSKGCLICFILVLLAGVFIYFFVWHRSGKSVGHDSETLAADPAGTDEATVDVSATAADPTADAHVPVTVDVTTNAKADVKADAKASHQEDWDDALTPEEDEIEGSTLDSPLKIVIIAPMESDEHTEKKSESETIYEAVEQQAQFPGGIRALMNRLINHVNYPEYARQNDIEGRVTVKFTVEKDGSISNPVVAKGVSKELDREAIRVVKNMPNWEPAKNNGVVVRSYFYLPIVFKSKNSE